MRRRRGNAVIEVTLLAPWIFFLFVGVFDMGFYACALICTENAARTAVAYTSSSAANAADTNGACGYALTEMYAMSNTRGLPNCNASPLILTATSVTGADGSAASQVQVTYQTMNLIAFPGFPGQLTITRTVQERIKSALP
jgi:Flp pilus assembly protein TadG